MSVFTTYKDLGNVKLPDIIENTSFIKPGYWLVLAIFSFIVIVFIFVYPFIGKTSSEMHNNINDWATKISRPIKQAFDSQLEKAYIDNNGAVHTYITEYSGRTNILDEIGI
jgi:hypothetical protein